MAMAMMPGRVLRPRTAEWQNRVKRLWGYRRDAFHEKSRLNSASSHPASHRCFTARSAPELRRFSDRIVKPFFPPNPRPSFSLANSSRSFSKPSTPSYKIPAWKEDVVPVPLGLVTQTQSRLLMGLVSKGSDAFLEQLHHPHKIGTNFQLLKLSPRLSGFGGKLLPPSSHEQLLKEQLRRRAALGTAGNVAFGRSNYASFLARNNGRFVRKSAGQPRNSIIPDPSSSVRPSGVKTTDTRKDTLSISKFNNNVVAFTLPPKQEGNAYAERRILSARSSRRESFFDNIHSDGRVHSASTRRESHSGNARGEQQDRH